MRMIKLVLGSLMTNCYILGDGKTVCVVDPGDSADKIIECVKKEGATIEAILVTHGHFDHVRALCDLREKTGAKVYMHEADISMLGDGNKSLGFMTGDVPKKCEVDIVLHGGETITFGDNTLGVLHTPGHSEGSVSFYAKDFVCSGDLVFKGSIGRYDFGDYTTEMESIDTLFDHMDDNALILPGHGDVTTVSYEKKHNPYIRQG